MNRTGDIFIDAGNFAYSYIKNRFDCSDHEAVCYVIERYLSDWNKAVFSFFPNSPFLQPRLTLEQRREAAEKIYLKGLYSQSHRDKIILAGSNSFANFYPAGQGAKKDLSTIRAHLFVPFACMRFKRDRLLSLLSINIPEIFEAVLAENLTINLNSQYPRTREGMYDFLVSLYEKYRQENMSVGVYRFTNYASAPEIDVKHFDHDSLKNAVIRYMFKGKKLWEIKREVLPSP